MHIPGHFTPFSQSLMNRGMKQTNNNIGNINNPNENIMGGGMQPGGPIFQETGISTGFGDSEMGIINPVQPSYGPEGVKSPLFSEGSMAAGFDVNNDGVVDMLDYAYAQNNPSGYTQEGFQTPDEYYQNLATQGGWTGTIDNPETTSFNEFMQDYVANYIPGQQGPMPPNLNMTSQELQQWIDTMAPEQMSQFENAFHTQYLSLIHI